MAEDCEIFKAMAVGKPKCHAIKGNDGGKILSSLETIQPEMARMTCAGRIKLTRRYRYTSNVYTEPRGKYFLHETFSHLADWTPWILGPSQGCMLQHARLSEDKNGKVRLTIGIFLLSGHSLCFTYLSFCTTKSCTFFLSQRQPLKRVWKLRCLGDVCRDKRYVFAFTK
ncbi:hypothetical protein TTRE_0000918001 [Trichuris trichiura]|uniref:Uncharacterized protein n=1 Tax=Trichuris trichiura TaxID=36087 RepID=A0A077ZPW3_TRITR|nr:hypothetical protein TTRE_0000918001 [Trichuris trichiura]